jgi:hypothetical protein
MINSDGDGEDGCRMHFLYGEGYKEERREIGRSRCDKRVTVIQYLTSELRSFGDVLPTSCKRCRAVGCVLSTGIRRNCGGFFSAKHSPHWPLMMFTRRSTKYTEVHSGLCV